MVQYYPLEQVVADITTTYTLDDSESKIFQSKLLVSAGNFRSGSFNFRTYNIKFAEIIKPLRIIIGKSGIYLKLSEVNYFLSLSLPVYKFKPLRKRGAPFKQNSMQALAASGVLEADTRAVAKDLKKHGNIIRSSKVATRLITDYPEYKGRKKSYVVKFINKNWFK